MQTRRPLLPEIAGTTKVWPNRALGAGKKWANGLLSRGEFEAMATAGPTVRYLQANFKGRGPFVAHDGTVHAPTLPVPVVEEVQEIFALDRTVQGWAVGGPAFTVGAGRGDVAETLARALREGRRLGVEGAEEVTEEGIEALVRLNREVAEDLATRFAREGVEESVQTFARLGRETYQSLLQANARSWRSWTRALSQPIGSIPGMGRGLKDLAITTLRSPSTMFIAAGLGLQLGAPALINVTDYVFGKVEELMKKLLGASDEELHRLAREICLAIRTGENIPQGSPVSSELLAAEYHITRQWARQNPGQCEARVFSVLKGIQPKSPWGMIAIAAAVLLGLSFLK